MYFFRSDYSSGAHPEILKAIVAANEEQWDGYGADDHSDNAKRIIRERIGRSDNDVYLMVGGTSTNLTAMASFLRPHESVVAPRTAHIYVHEAGAVEATGHRVSAWITPDGKLRPEHIIAAKEEYEDEHMVWPKMIYISNTTEIGTVYTKAELTALRECCDKYDMYMYIDGARLGSALTSPANDLTIEEIAAMADAFYIGGTKNGLLFGEALVVNNDNLKPGFDHIMKQRGALLAKGFLIGAQFEALFKDDLYFKLAAHANDLAAKLRAAITECGYTFEVDSPSNQIFPIFKLPFIEELEKEFFFYRWHKIDEEQWSIRLVTSWESREEEVDAFIQYLRR
jgi:threonine aldolase